ncbi:hypothetical protein [Bradyrhizobium acaciae]|uniref:hypothetical protein n=1 Tax=Bradyrhizobium acaciae TaxID=2683706 RepID=UPI001E2892E6|nr:hypothetical protein [Bradyrhizobium acaciae]MCC8978930.1 hypothetical protein [Bradyrhizobium acaciae]
MRYRLTVEVQDGDQLKAGSSVIDLSYNIEPSWSPSQFNSFPVPVGYAPTVDLGEKGMLFLTFDHAARTPAQQLERNKQVFCLFDDLGCLPFAAYRKSGGGIEFKQKKAALDELLRQSGPRDVPFIALTQLIRFVDENGEHKYLTLPPDNLARGFGEGVELKRVILELTTDPVTPRPDSWPNWLKEKGQMSATLKGYGND